MHFLETVLLTSFSYALGATLPLGLMIFLGFMLKKHQKLNDTSIQHANWLVFHCALPALLFHLMLEADWRDIIHSPLTPAALLTTAIIFIIGLRIALYCVDKDHVSVVAQGAYRGNLGIVALALIHSLQGEVGLREAALPVALVTLLYNIIAVYLFSQHGSHRTKISWYKTLVAMASNPLILAIFSGGLCSLFIDNFPAWFEDLLRYLGNMALPLALLCTGASLSWRGWPHRSTLIACVLRLILAPGIAISVALILSLNTTQFIQFFCLFSVPAASAGYIMAKQMRGNAEIAAEIVAFTTFASMLTLPVWLSIIHISGFS